MGLNLLMSYPLWTLLCALFFPIVAAIATFVCLRRAKTARKLIGFFVIIPILAAVIVVLLSDTGSIMSDLLAKIEIPYPPVIGFLAAITLGIFCLNLTALICGAGLLKPRGAITNSIAAVICIAANVYIIYETWICAPAGKEELISIQTALPFVSKFTFLPDIILRSGVEMLCLSILALFLLIYFLSFIAIRSRDEILKEDLERRRRSALNSQNRPAPKHESNEDEELPKCCACCEHATALSGDRTKMVCDSFGVVLASHTCRRFLYDPLKRIAARPKIEPPAAEELPPLDLDHI